MCINQWFNKWFIKPSSLYTLNILAFADGISNTKKRHLISHSSFVCKFFCAKNNCVAKFFQPISSFISFLTHQIVSIFFWPGGFAWFTRIFFGSVFILLILGRPSSTKSLQGAPLKIYTDCTTLCHIVPQTLRLIDWNGLGADSVS